MLVAVFPVVWLYFAVMRRSFIQLHTAVFLAGFTGILGKLITLNEGLLVWYRLLFTSVTLWILYRWQQRVQKLSAAIIMKLFGVGIVAALHWVTFYASIKQSNVSVALVCFSSIGFFTALLEPLLMQQRVKIIEVLLGLLTIAGIYLIFHFDPNLKTGIIIGITSAMLGCLFPIFNRRLLQSVTPENVSLYELTGGFLFLTLLMPFYLSWFPADKLLPGWHDLMWLLILAWLCTVIAFNLTMQALRKISAFTVNLSYNLEPVYGIVLAFIVFREDRVLKSSFYWGFSLIVLSIMIQTIIIYNRQRNAPGKL